MNSQLGNSFFSHSQAESPLRVPFKDIHVNTAHSKYTNKENNFVNKSKQLKEMQQDLNSQIVQNEENLKNFAYKSEEISDQLEKLDSQVEKIEINSLMSLKQHTDNLIIWNKKNNSIAETNFTNKKNTLEDFYKNLQSDLIKENNEISDEFQANIKVLINDFQEKRYQRHLWKRQQDVELEDMKNRIFGKLNDTQIKLEDVSRKRKQYQEKAVILLSDLKKVFEKRLMQSERERDENEIVLAQMLDSIITKFD